MDSVSQISNFGHYHHHLVAACYIQPGADSKYVLRVYEYLYIHMFCNLFSKLSTLMQPCVL